MIYTKLKGIILLEKLIVLSIWASLIPFLTIIIIEISSQASVLIQAQRSIRTTQEVLFRVFVDMLSVNTLISVDERESVFHLTGGKFLTLSFKGGQFKRNYNQHVMHMTPPLFVEEGHFETRLNGQLWCIRVKRVEKKEISSCFRVTPWRDND
tara:strand:+ start:598 stop:1056 length:459 start_codon:yes stop_codon:yes gene_type:complete